MGKGTTSYLCLYVAQLWVLQSEPSGRRTHSTRGTLALLPKPAMNGVMKNVIYADVKSTVGRGIGGVCAVTRGGSLCLMWGTSRVVDKQINLNVRPVLFD